MYNTILTSQLKPVKRLLSKIQNTTSLDEHQRRCLNGPGRNGDAGCPGGAKEMVLLPIVFEGKRYEKLAIYIIIFILRWVACCI